MADETTRKRRGRPAGKKLTPYTVTLDPRFAEWGLDQPEGLSGILRTCLEQTYQKRTSSQPSMTKETPGDYDA